MWMKWHKLLQRLSKFLFLLLSSWMMLRPGAHGESILMSSGSRIKLLYLHFHAMETGDCTRHIRNAQPWVTWHLQERDQNEREGLSAKLMYLHCDLMLPARVSTEPEVFNRFSLSMLQSKLIERPLITRMLLLLLELKPYKTYTSSYCLIKSQMNRKVNHRQAVVLV